MRFRRTIGVGSVVECVHPDSYPRRLRKGAVYKVSDVQIAEDGYCRVELAPLPGRWWGLFRFRTIWEDERSGGDAGLRDIPGGPKAAVRDVRPNRKAAHPAPPPEPAP